MDKKSLENCTVNIFENGIWDIGEGHGKIKRWAIEELSEIASNISQDAVLTSAIHSDGLSRCPCCGELWDMKNYNACQCGAVISRR